VVVTKAWRCRRRSSAPARLPGRPLLTTRLLSSIFISKIQAFWKRSGPQTALHGVLVTCWHWRADPGKSGIGKSECALDLIMKGHRLVADDVVTSSARARTWCLAPAARSSSTTWRSAPGILNIKDLFGVASVRDRKRIELVVELVEWSDKEEYDRLGIDERRYTILGWRSAAHRAGAPGRNMTSIIEVAARNQLLKIQGHHSAGSSRSG